jgi:cation diffusion facilitator family transporter
LNPQIKNLNLQKSVAGISIFLLVIKFAAYYLTNSVSILTDALESIVNVTAGFIGWYSLFVSAKPRDKDHPYGHGKAEFISAAVEGTLILAAAGIIIYNAVKNLLFPVSISKLDYGMLLVAASGIINFLIGYLCLRQGKRGNSLALVASGKHLQSDSYSTAGIIIGLVLIIFTGYIWIDSIVAIVIAFFILYTGYRILRRSIAGIMDEADIELLNKLVRILNTNRKKNWVDLHNLRIIKYGSVLHVDCHLTLPWYLNINEAHIEIDDLSRLIRNEFGETIELFVHTDGCLYSQCPICFKDDCPVRKHPFEKRITWTLENILQDKKHELKELSELNQ